MTLATQLHAAGYTTSLTGKWLNAYSLIAPAPPPGFDRFEAFGEADYYDYDLWRYGRATPEHHGAAPSDYSTDVVAAKAIDALRSAPTGQPLFAWIAPYAPHSAGHQEEGGTPVPAPRYASEPRCGSIPGWSPPNYNEADVSDKPKEVRSLP